MPLGSRWQALLFSELRFYFCTTACQNLKRVVWIHWNMSFLGSVTSNHLLCSLCVIAFLWIADADPSVPLVAHAEELTPMSNALCSVILAPHCWWRKEIKNKWVFWGNPCTVCKRFCCTVLILTHTPYFANTLKKKSLENLDVEVWQINKTEWSSMKEFLEN